MQDVPVTTRPLLVVVQLGNAFQVRVPVTGGFLMILRVAIPVDGEFAATLTLVMINVILLVIPLYDREF